MIVLIHVLLALGGIVYTSYLLFSPSRAKLYGSYAFLAGTIASGTYLVFLTKTHILQTCMMGLLYTGFISVGLAVAHRKLAAERADTKR